MTHEEMRYQPPNIFERNEIQHQDELRELFESDEEDDFYGFNVSGNAGVRELFETDDEEGEFYGFNTSGNIGLESIFFSESDNEEFCGF